MNLNFSEWKEFYLNDLFDVINGKGITKDEIFEHPGDLEAVQSGETNNGVLGRIDKNYCINMGYSICEKPCLTVARSGSAGFVSLHERGCVVGDSAKILLLKEENARTRNVYLFMQTLLSANRFKYSYGRKLTTLLCKNTVLKLPVKNGKPNWQFIEDYITTLKHKPISTANIRTTNNNIFIHSWHEFKFGDLISAIYKSRPINKEDISPIRSVDNAIRYITRTAINNGCETMALRCEIPENIIEKGNAISIGDTTATCFYQEKDFITGDHIVVVRADEWMNKYTALFVLTLLQKEQFKYSYGRAFLMDQIKNTMIKLPIDKNGCPDWKYMEGYIKALPFGDRL